MKKTTLLLVALILCFSIVACEGGETISESVSSLSQDETSVADNSSVSNEETSIEDSSVSDESTPSDDSSATDDTSTDDTSSEDVSADDTSSEPSEDLSDDEPPVISIESYTVLIRVGEGYDLMTGVSGYDEAEGDVTDKIEIDKGGFDPSVAGEYTVTYSLKDRAGNSAEPKTRNITVINSKALISPTLYTGEIDGEIKNPKPAPVYGGAWYHKVVSSKDEWVGIEATVTLPEIKLSRYKDGYVSSLDVDPNVKSQDNPSIYLGGNALTESDVGLSLSLGVINQGAGTISKGSIVFRPFWRYITETDQDVGGYDVHDGLYAVSANGNNCYANYHWKYTEYYYLPGDTLRIIVYSPEPDKLQLQIEVISKSTLESSVEMRKKYGWKDPETFISPIFSSPGHGKGTSAEFKRVNAIDQSGNEGGTAIMTETEITNAIWHSTYLYRYIDGELYRVPMDESRRATTDAPNKEAFTVESDAERSAIGGETVSIHPSKQ